MSVQTNQNGKTIDQLLENLYYHSPAGFSTVQRLYKAAKKVNDKITQIQVKEWLEKQRAYTRHRKVQWKFPRRKVLVLRRNFLWSSDLIVIDSLKSANDSYCYILNTIDCFSKRIWMKKLKTKSSVEMSQAMESIIQENDGESPYRLWTDSGRRETSTSDALWDKIRLF